MQVLHGFQLTCDGVSVFSLWKNSGWGNNKHYWHLVLYLRGFIFIMPGYDSCEKQHKVGIKLMCPFVDNLLKFLQKSLRQLAEKCSKELSRDALIDESLDANKTENI